MTISLDTNWDAGRHGRGRASTWGVAAGLALWLALVAWLGTKGAFLASPTSPPVGVLTSPSALGVFADPAASANMGEMPLSPIPTFAVPLWTIFHIITLLQLRRLVAARS